MTNKISETTNIIFNIIFIILALAAIIPFILVLMISISDEEAIRLYSYHLIPKKFSLEAYRFLWNERATMLRSFGISLSNTLIGTFISVMLTTSMGYVLSRPQYKMKGFLTYMIFIPMIFSGGMVASFVVNINILHLRDTIWSMILPLLISSFNIIICRSFFKSTIPESVIESARIDGASQLRIYGGIVLPLSTPVIATMALFASFGYWNDWFQASLYISNPNLIPLQTMLMKLQADIDYIASNPAAGVSLQQYIANMPTNGVRMAIAVVVITPIACAYPFFQKYFISGLTIGAVKG
ncbi:MAG: carbohydrate ABC transporter permease [Treponema sp.]